MQCETVINEKSAFVEMLKSGVIMDVMNPEQAKMAEEAGACSVMALERIPALIRKEGGIARASDPEMIQQIQEAVSIPVMAKCRIGHFIEARILEVLDVDCIDESEVLTPADHEGHIDKHPFKIPFVCGCYDLYSGLRRIEEGAALIRCKGQAGTGDISEAVKHLKLVRTQIEQLVGMNEEQLEAICVAEKVKLSTLLKVKEMRRMPVPFFAAGGVATPADAALCMHLGAESVFVGSGIFLSQDPVKRANAIVEAVHHWNDFKRIAECSHSLGMAMQ